MALMALLQPDLPPGGRFGALAEFATPAELYTACEGVRDAGYTRWDAHTPFPIHGLDRAMGLRASRLPWISLALALGGAVAGMGLQDPVALQRAGEPARQRRQRLDHPVLPVDQGPVAVEGQHREVGEPHSPPLPAHRPRPATSLLGAMAR